MSIAERPQDVLVPDWLPPTLQRLQQGLQGALAIISGRPSEQIDAFVHPLRLAVAGVHGAERRDANGRLSYSRASPPPSVVASVQALVQRHAGLMLEPKPSGLALHFRARPELELECRKVLFRALQDAPGASADWEWLPGLYVLELKQRGVHKGLALRAFMAEPAFARRVPVFVGDDTTDEDAIEAAQAAGGFGVRVGSGNTQAHYRLHNPGAVAVWLTRAAQAMPPGTTKESPT